MLAATRRSSSVPFQSSHATVSFERFGKFQLQSPINQPSMVGYSGIQVDSFAAHGYKKTEYIV